MRRLALVALQGTQPAQQGRLRDRCVLRVRRNRIVREDLRRLHALQDTRAARRVKRSVWLERLLLQGTLCALLALLGPIQLPLERARLRRASLAILGHTRRV